MTQNPFAYMSPSRAISISLSRTTLPCARPHFPRFSPPPPPPHSPDERPSYLPSYPQPHLLCQPRRLLPRPLSPRCPRQIRPRRTARLRRTVKCCLRRTGGRARQGARCSRKASRRPRRGLPLSPMRLLPAKPSPHSLPPVTLPPLPAPIPSQSLPPLPLLRLYRTMPPPSHPLPPPFSALPPPPGSRSSFLQRPAAAYPSIGIPSGLPAAVARCSPSEAAGHLRAASCSVAITLDIPIVTFLGFALAAPPGLPSPTPALTSWERDLAYLLAVPPLLSQAAPLPRLLIPCSLESPIPPADTPFPPFLLSLQCLPTPSCLQAAQP